ncbi:hypothetical protein OEZ85_011060 [Tetradesmus obliquus]|uniref:ABC1 atypical kinase-like domain-containing protein n=1 Tax=Tetradesmus obliquus TaxID=3088 RepID=A0ABY8TPT8_TETOB|nr:hypothetical protein OEZ85_011060 [Tetradesmus obliquus]
MAVARGQACEIELVCARNGDPKSAVLNHLVHRCITCMQQPEQQCTHMFVEASPISVNGTRCYFLQHALQGVFGFTRLTQNDSSAGAWKALVAGGAPPHNMESHRGECPAAATAVPRKPSRAHEKEECPAAPRKPACPPKISHATHGVAPSDVRTYLVSADAMDLRMRWWRVATDARCWGSAGVQRWSKEASISATAEYGAMQAHLLYAAAEHAVLARCTTPQHRCERLCHRIEQLGPAAIKLGQLMATTPGLVTDPVLQAQLSSRLHDKVRPQPFSKLMQPQSMAELSSMLPAAAVIASEPIGSASIAQVHVAELPGGARTAIKVVRPRAGHLIRSSFAAIRATLQLVHRWLPSGSDADAMHHTQLLLSDACCMLEAEVDMATEFSNMQQCHDNAANGSLVYVPKPLGHGLNGRVLLMEYVHSQPLALACKAHDKAQRAGLARAIASWWLEGVLRHRVVHGDPHIGNWGMTATGQLVLYDYGNVVHLAAPELRSVLRLLEALLAVLTKFPGQAHFKREAEAAGKQCGVHILDWDTFEGDVAGIVRYLTAPGSVQLSKGGFRDRSRVPARLSGPALRLVRSLLLVDGVCRTLDDQFAWKV